MQAIAHQSIDSAWPTLVNSCLRGRHDESRDGDMREVIGTSFRINPLRNILFNPIRRASLVYGAAEFLWYLSWSNEGEHICAYAPGYERFLNMNGNADGAYGPRWFRQILPLIEELSNGNTRRAVMGTWSPGDLGVKTKDCPRALSFQFIIRSGRLHMITTMRSNDVWSRTPYDVFCFTSLQRLIADWLDLELGGYQHQIGSLHLHDRDAEKAALVESTTDGPAIRYINHPKPPAGLFWLINQATRIEAYARRVGMEFSELRSGLRKASLERTMLGSYVALAWLNFANKCPSLHDLGLVMPGQLALVAENWWKRRHTS